MKLSSILFIVFTLLCSCSTSKQVQPITTSLSSATTPKQAKNVILMIGDGMGLSQITAAMIRNGYDLNLAKMPITGLHKSYSYDNLITDSAAGATAFACGVKSYNGAIGVDQDTQAVQTILEEAENKGLKTGMVATSTIVHATPASFIAHVASRASYEDIAADFLKVDIDYFAGGGKKYFDRRADERNISAELEGRGYTVKTYLDNDISKLKIDKTKKFGYLTADNDPLPVAQGRDYLTDASIIGLNHLKYGDKGFFMMIEGSQIDWGGHANNAEYVITELLDFDKAIGEVIEWIKKDGETLLVITADHETGGFAINGGTPDSLKIAFTTKNHTGTLIPVFAMGPGQELFSGIYENTAIYDKMRKALGWPKRNKPVILKQ